MDDYTNYSIRNVGWSVGAFCNAHCIHCYSRDIRSDGDLLTPHEIVLVLDKLTEIGVSTINLGGNEPIFTHSMNPKDSLLPFIIHEIKKRGITLGITTNGTTLLLLNEMYKDAFNLVDDWDISLDSPFPDEHDRNRGSGFYLNALKALELSKSLNRKCSIAYCLMNINCSEKHAKALAELTNNYKVDLRINTLKPTRDELNSLLATPQELQSFFEILSMYYTVIHNSDIATTINTKHPLSNCPCGKYSLAISPKKNNTIKISPCVYLQQYAVGNILTDDVLDILETPLFRAFRKTGYNNNPECNNTECCSGGCLAYTILTSSKKQCDPRCPIINGFTANLLPKSTTFNQAHVHENYLCTWIGANK